MLLQHGSLHDAPWAQCGYCRAQCGGERGGVGRADKHVEIEPDSGMFGDIKR